jgi:hypothetical protein
MGIIYITSGMFLINWGWHLHQEVVNNYHCIPCSVFQKECPIRYDTEENQQCWGSSEWPWKISLAIPFLGFFLVITPFIMLFNDYYEYFKGGKKDG